MSKQASPNNSSVYRKYAKDDHKRAARMLGFSLTRGSTDAWADFSWFIHSKLSQNELAGIAWASLWALSEENAVEICKNAIGSAGCPHPPLFPDDVANDANWWGDHASITELRAYSTAAYRRLSSRDRRLIVEHFENRNAA